MKASSSPQLIVLCLVSFLTCKRVSCFLVSPATLLTASSRAVLTLSAKKKPNKRSSNTNSSGGGGFGSKDTESSSSVKKTRTVSGYTGSGTKPLRVAATTFDRLRNEYGADCTNDVYVRSPLHDESTFWFVGKVARCLEEKNLRGNSIPTPQQAVVSQKRLILEYAKHQLRPQTMGGPYASALQVWLAPGDSEMDVVQNKISLEKVEGSASSLLDEDFNVADVGFNPEIYVGDEVVQGGLRVTRDANGHPVKPVFQVNESV